MNTAMRLLGRLHGVWDEADPEGGSPTPAAPPEKSVTPEIDYDKLAAAMVKAQQAPPPKDKDESVHDKIQAKQKQEQEEQAKVAELRAIIEFDKSFDSVLDDNKSMFSMSAKEIRDGAKNLENQELVDTLKRTAAKNFFSKEENAKYLDDKEQQYVKDEVVRVTEKYIDAEKAWSLLEKTLLINKRIQQHAGYKQSGDSTSTETPNIDAYLKKCRDRGAGIQPTNA